MRNTFMVSYDLSDSNRLRKVFKTMKAWWRPLASGQLRQNLSRITLRIES